MTGHLDNEGAYSNQISSALLDRGAKYILSFNFKKWIDWAKANQVRDLICGSSGAFQMKRKFTITFEVDVNYPHIKKETKKIAETFDQWLHDWADSDSAPRDIIPVLYTGNPDNEHQANGIVRVKIVRDGEEILNTWWDELSDDF